MKKKKTVIVEREKEDFECQICRRMVEIGKAKAWTIETDTHIFKTWDYGHRHDKEVILDDVKLQEIVRL